MSTTWCGPSSTAIALVRWSKAAFDTRYGVTVGAALMLVILEMFTMLPPCPLSIIPFATTCKRKLHMPILKYICVHLLCSYPLVGCSRNENTCKEENEERETMAKERRQDLSWYIACTECWWILLVAHILTANVCWNPLTCDTLAAALTLILNALQKQNTILACRNSNVRWQSDPVEKLSCYSWIFYSMVTYLVVFILDKILKMLQKKEPCFTLLIKPFRRHVHEAFYDCYTSIVDQEVDGANVLHSFPGDVPVSQVHTHGMHAWGLEYMGDLGPLANCISNWMLSLFSMFASLHVFHYMQTLL